MPSIETSILVFEITKKYLLFKILSKDLNDLLRQEIIKNFGTSYVDEKTQPNNFRSDRGQSLLNPSQQESTENKTNNNQAYLDNDDEQVDKTNLIVNNELIYEYFSPIVNSFEISKELNYIYEYALFNKNNYIIRFLVNKNLLILCIQNSNSFCGMVKSDVMKSIYSEYYSGWFDKSIISLMKYKLSICCEDKCFTNANIIEIKSLYLKWCEFHSTDPVYFVEAIEQLDINEDLKIKCHQFLDEFVNFLNKTDIILSEFDFMDESFEVDEETSEGTSEDTSDGTSGDTSNEDDNLLFQADSTNEEFKANQGEKSRRRRSNRKSNKYEDLESFFNNFQQFNFFMLTYGNKLLYKYKTNKPNEDSNFGENNFDIDSSSIFMLLLEASAFLEVSSPDRSMNSSFERNNSADGDDYASASGSPYHANGNSTNSLNRSASFKSNHSFKKATKNIIRNSVNKKINELEDSLSSSTSSSNNNSVSHSIFKTPSDQVTQSYYSHKIKRHSSSASNHINENVLKEESENEIENEASDKIEEKPLQVKPNIVAEVKDKIKHKFKKTTCFLLNSNKYAGFYEVLFLRLSDNLCLIMLKSNDMSKYCELISDFDSMISDFMSLIYRKRIMLSNLQESLDSNSLSQDSNSVSSSQARSNPSPAPTLRQRRYTIASQQQQQQLQDVDKAFLSFFMNKLIIFYEKLNNLKNEINARVFARQKSTSSVKGESNNNFLARAFNLNANNNMRNRINSRRRRTSSSSSSKSKSNSSTNSTSAETMANNNLIKLIHILQIKINQFTKVKEFKDFVSFINNGSLSSSSNNNEQQSLNSSFYLDASSTSYNFNIAEFLDSFRTIESQINLIQTNTDQLFYELFLDGLTSSTGEITISTRDSRSESNNFLKNPRNFMKPREEGKLNDSNKKLRFKFSNFKSTRLIEILNDLFHKHLYHYTPYLDIKFRRNIAMSFYWHQIPGLIHFTFINRSDNTCLLPTIEDSPEFNLSKSKIDMAYRKYLPLVMTFLYKNECTQFQFNDDLLTIVFSYFIWFEDKKYNNIPVDFANTNKLMYNSSTSNDLLANSRLSEANKNLFLQKSSKKNQDLVNQYNPPGITHKSYYDLIKTMCYPFAPTDSLTCYELMCIHSNRLSDGLIKSQFKYLVSNLSKMSRSF